MKYFNDTKLSDFTLFLSLLAVSISASYFLKLIGIPFFISSGIITGVFLGLFNNYLLKKKQIRYLVNNIEKKHLTFKSEIDISCMEKKDFEELLLKIEEAKNMIFKDISSIFGLKVTNDLEFQAMCIVMLHNDVFNASIFSYINNEEKFNSFYFGETEKTT